MYIHNLFICEIYVFQDEPLPSHSAQALHQQPPPEDQRRDALNKQESKINEEKLQVGFNVDSEKLK